MPHALDLAEARKRVEEAARDLSEGSLKRTNPMIEAREQNRVVLKGRSDRGSHFEAEIEVKVDSIEVAIKGALVLTMIEVTLAGGAAGVRRRVQAEVERALKERMEAA